MIGSGRRLFTNHLPDIFKALTHCQSIYLSIYLSALIYSIYLSINMFTYLSNLCLSYCHLVLSIISVQLSTVHKPFYLYKNGTLSIYQACINTLSFSSFSKATFLRQSCLKRDDDKQVHTTSKTSVVDYLPENYMLHIL